eukprot:CAMPEP_0172803092 /NCGR_PEP_ID=MMETSP1075-20121228/4261_1 /TAXON_ID=2916 /ORGANISM="Ceratium fusus, Strain PA161109" /LENGTH=77 /DNA_ID=CAMNT_0013641443 /DNA_START=547 /DNA_END=777 /DNA_ORIENTATION=-
MEQLEACSLSSRGMSPLAVAVVVGSVQLWSKSKRSSWWLGAAGDAAGAAVVERSKSCTSGAGTVVIEKSKSCTSGAA